MSSLTKVQKASIAATLPEIAPAKQVVQINANSPASSKKSFCTWLVEKIQAVFRTILYYLTCKCCSKESKKNESESSSKKIIKPEGISLAVSQQNPSPISKTQPAHIANVASIALHPQAPAPQNIKPADSTALNPQSSQASQNVKPAVSPILNPPSQVPPIDKPAASTTLRPTVPVPQNVKPAASSAVPSSLVAESTLQQKDATVAVKVWRESTKKEIWTVGRATLKPEQNGNTNDPLYTVAHYIVNFHANRASHHQIETIECRKSQLRFIDPNLQMDSKKIDIQMLRERITQSLEIVTGIVSSASRQGSAYKLTGQAGQSWFQPFTHLNALSSNNKNPSTQDYERAKAQDMEEWTRNLAQSSIVDITKKIRTLIHLLRGAAIYCSNRDNENVPVPTELLPGIKELQNADHDAPKEITYGIAMGTLIRPAIQTLENWLMRIAESSLSESSS